MSEAIERLLERLQTGWTPSASEIDRDIVQVDALTWEWSHDGRSILSRSADQRPQIHGGILYVSERLDFALTTDAFLWLERQRQSTVIEYNIPDDLLGYDTSQPGYIRQMARDALTGRNEAAVEAELERVRARLMLPRHHPTRRQRLRRWLSHRYWRARFWIKDLIK
ncbi:MAG: hypothetical protein J0H40_17290 [Rhizobiales bacterium]|nr:hypothetical protein [Hyphomicrobiales bacterium]